MIIQFKNESDAKNFIYKMKGMIAITSSSKTGILLKEGNSHPYEISFRPTVAFAYVQAHAMSFAEGFAAALGENARVLW